MAQMKALTVNFAMSVYQWNDSVIVWKQVVIEDWRKHYNDVRPHSSLNYQTPNEFKLSLTESLTTGANFSN
jgi:transposase InsO family protein